jgi:hypothetical protein
MLGWRKAKKYLWDLIFRRSLARERVAAIQANGAVMSFFVNAWLARRPPSSARPAAASAWRPARSSAPSSATLPAARSAVGRSERAPEPTSPAARSPAAGVLVGGSARAQERAEWKLEIADVFRRHGEAWRSANAGHLSLAQRRVMTAIESCRTSALGGHVERCEDCTHTRVAYNSCRNRHCPKCQWSTAATWLAAREAEVLPVPYFHVVFTLPASLGAMAFQNKAVVYRLLFRAASEALSTLAGDPKHLGADIGVTAVLHTWGQKLDHHPHLHCIVPAGGISPDGKQWIAFKRGRFLPVRILSRLFRGLFLQQLTAAFEAGELQFFTDLLALNDPTAFGNRVGVLRRTNWRVYAQKPFRGPKHVLAYLTRYTHRTAITNSRLINLDETHVSFRWTDYRENAGHRTKIMRIGIGEFIRRFLLHVLPNGFHRIRHYGFLANGHRAEKLALSRRLLGVPATSESTESAAPGKPIAPKLEVPPCPCCGGRMKITEAFNGKLADGYCVHKLDGL